MKKPISKRVIIFAATAFVVIAAVCLCLLFWGKAEPSAQLQVPTLTLQEDFSVLCNGTEDATGYYYTVSRNGEEKFDYGVLTKDGKMLIGPYEESGFYVIQVQAIRGMERSAFSQPVTFTVHGIQLPESALFQVVGRGYCFAGQDYTFTLQLSANTTGKPVVTANGTPVEEQGGYYVIKGVSQDLVIAVSGIEKDPEGTTPPVTEPPVTQPPVIDPPVTEPPVTDPPVTEPEIPENERFLIDSASSCITADPVKGTLHYDGSIKDTEVFFAASEDRACATSWEMTGTITKANKDSSLFLSFGVRNNTGKEMWFCLLDDSMALQRYWNWWDTKQPNDSTYVQYNLAGSDFFWHRNPVLHYKLVLKDDVLQVYFGNNSQALSLAWYLPLTESKYGGFAAGTAYQIGINTVDPLVMTISDVRVKVSGAAGFKLDELFLRDPYILESNGTYYLYGTRAFGKFEVYTSKDLDTWYYGGICFEGGSGFWGNDTTNSEQAYWAPEVHAYKGAYYMFATFTKPGTQHQQATTILRSDSPLGPFQEWSEGFITPNDHSCLDGTLYVENGVPYLIYAHEWQCTCKSSGIGSMAYIQLSADLKNTVGEPTEWFSAEEYTDYSRLEMLLGKRNTTVTDGPAVYEVDGQKYLLWSTSLDGTYIQIATKFGYIGEDIHVKNSSCKLYATDGGHGMIFTGADGNAYLVLHTPNSGETRPMLLIVEHKDGKLILKP